MKICAYAFVLSLAILCSHAYGDTFGNSGAVSFNSGIPGCGPQGDTGFTPFGDSVTMTCSTNNGGLKLTGTPKATAAPFAGLASVELTVASGVESAVETVSATAGVSETYGTYPNTTGKDLTVTVLFVGSGVVTIPADAPDFDWSTDVTTFITADTPTGLRTSPCQSPLKFTSWSCIASITVVPTGGLRMGMVGTLTGTLIQHPGPTSAVDVILDYTHSFDIVGARITDAGGNVLSNSVLFGSTPIAQITSAPEPSGWILVGTVLIGCLACRSTGSRRLRIMRSWSGERAG